jgi:cathepsin D
MGLAWPQLADFKATKPFFNTLIDSHAVAVGKFGFKLTKTNSFLYLGGVEPSYSSAKFTSVKVTKKGFWQVNMDSANVGDKSAVTSLPVIIDTGTTIIVGAKKSVSTFYKSIKGARVTTGNATIPAGFYTFPCNSSPKVSLTFGGSEYDISSTFNLGRVEEGSSDCVGGIMGDDTGRTFFYLSFPCLETDHRLNLVGDLWVVGDVFLTNVYAQFSFDNDTVSFAKQR